jgi:hypothetical protein
MRSHHSDLCILHKAGLSLRFMQSALSLSAHLTRRGFPGCPEDNATPNRDGTVGEAFIGPSYERNIRGGCHVVRPILLLKRGEQRTATERAAHVWDSGEMSKR